MFYEQSHSASRNSHRIVISQEELASRARQHAGVNISLSTVRRIWQNNQAGSPRPRPCSPLPMLGVTIGDLYAER